MSLVPVDHDRLLLAAPADLLRTLDAQPAHLAHAAIVDRFVEPTDVCCLGA
jgi:hypothetical protein